MSGGARDRVFPDSQAREAVAHLPDGSLALIPECGHMPHVECPAHFLAVLGEFFGGRGHRSLSTGGSKNFEITLESPGEDPERSSSGPDPSSQSARQVKEHKER